MRQMLAKIFRFDKEIAYWRKEAEVWETRYDRVQSEAYDEISTLRNNIEQFRKIIYGR